jgi:hypothetical protein
MGTTGDLYDSISSVAGLSNSGVRSEADILTTLSEAPNPESLQRQLAWSMVVQRLRKVDRG